MEEVSTRSHKIARLIQKDIGDILQKECSSLVKGALVSVTVVRMSPDYGLAKVYISVFPFEKHPEIMAKVKEGAWQVRLELGKRIRNQMRTVPEVAFFLDDSMEYASNIEKLL